jgi:hypothetical protein
MGAVSPSLPLASAPERGGTPARVRPGFAATPPPRRAAAVGPGREGSGCLSWLVPVAFVVGVDDGVAAVKLAKGFSFAGLSIGFLFVHGASIRYVSERDKC